MTAKISHSAGHAWLRALGVEELPETIKVGGRPYRHLVTFKHDFFAATGAYEGAEGRVILKLQRRASFFGVPLLWLGRFLAAREARMCELLGSIEGIPRFVGRWGPTGLVRECIAGEPLTKNTQVNDGFFPRLADMLREIHELNAAYVDLEKPENILVGLDGRPHLFDFQISWYLPANRLGNTWVADHVLRILQASDQYHLLKHRRRIRPDQLSPDEIARSLRPPAWIGWHRTLFRPLTKLRRRVLVQLRQRTSYKTRSPG